MGFDVAVHIMTNAPRFIQTTWPSHPSALGASGTQVGFANYRGVRAHLLLADTVECVLYDSFFRDGLYGHLYNARALAMVEGAVGKLLDNPTAQPDVDPVDLAWIERAYAAHEHPLPSFWGIVSAVYERRTFQRTFSRALEEGILAPLNGWRDYYLDLEWRGYESFDSHTLEFARNRYFWYERGLPNMRLDANSLGSDLLLRLPGLNAATGDELVDVRNELKPYAVRFNAKLLELERDLSERNSRYESVEVERVYRQHVLPALLDIDESIKSDTAIGRFLNALNVSNPGTGTVLGVGLMSLLNSNPAVQAIGGAVAATGAAYGAHKEVVKEKLARERNGMYFYHRADKRLAKGQ